ncbi:J domain-containing protein required for chloroplast accumulation response 1 isoform X1 [Amborella trichopoda]|uniref:J domain-containing protein n=1 Tax=Amborella trichopoda TaxID=13333 RepID=U5D845_AMBTC|nr:J domain-containing protein required for chloroplast accumulation response 1 isoform X1 [Amborella trichopoda]ERN17577.1 hypothetical protein AMTR_s00059p00139560 [Amborella trichopoda]|eukprot:XP_006856110.1 J domain-containing protein required for chloroplast accumulation response 1 isoform X1 [Amborella trichopoda]
MEKWGVAENLLCGHSTSRISLETGTFSVTSSPNFSYRNTDVNVVPQNPLGPAFDFDDVFGGPPRSSSISESRYSFNGAFEGKPSAYKEEILPSKRNPSFGMREQPVFGENSRVHRRLLGEDFFDDIFNGGSSSERNSLSSPSTTPRFLAPGLLNGEALSPGPSLPPNFSLSSKLGKGIDPPAFSSPTRRSPLMRRATFGSPSASPGFFLSSPREQPEIHGFKSKIGTQLAQRQDDPTMESLFKSKIGTQLVQRQDDPTMESRLRTHRQTPVSIQIPFSSYEPTKPSDTLSKDSPEVSQSENQFHFSIHKWAGKAVGYLIPVKKDNLKKQEEEPKINELSEVYALPTIKYLSTIPCSSDDHLENQHIESVQDRPATRNDHIKKLDHISSNESSIHKGADKEELLKEPREPTHKPLHHFLHDDNEERATVKDKLVEQGGKKEGSLQGNVPSENANDSIQQKEIIGETLSKQVKATRPSLANSESKMRGNRVKGKVKEFINIFNQDPKPMSKTEGNDQVSGVKDRVSHKGDAQEAISSDFSDNQVKMANGTIIADLPEIPIVVDRIQNQRENSSVDEPFSVHEVHDLSWNDTEVPSGTVNHSMDGLDRRKESYGKDTQENFRVEYALEKHKHQMAKIQPEEEFQESDTKLRNWSRGKEGNIRSLLSTLQYVLWPGSGWRPVPLVDIIEGSAVKRAYQRALLCLHPDKLQQRGVTVHQKYIAEKVFDILQEAWTHFNNSIGSF